MMCFTLPSNLTEDECLSFPATIEMLKPDIIAPFLNLLLTILIKLTKFGDKGAGKDAFIALVSLSDHQ